MKTVKYLMSAIGRSLALRLTQSNAKIGLRNGLIISEVTGVPDDIDNQVVLNKAARVATYAPTSAGLAAYSVPWDLLSSKNDGALLKWADGKWI